MDREALMEKRLARLRRENRRLKAKLGMLEAKIEQMYDPSRPGARPVSPEVAEVMDDDGTVSAHVQDLGGSGPPLA